MTQDKTTPWPSWLRRATVNRKIVSSTLTGVVNFSFLFFFYLRRRKNFFSTPGMANGKITWHVISSNQHRPPRANMLTGRALAISRIFRYTNSIYNITAFKEGRGNGEQNILLYRDIRQFFLAKVY